MSAPRYFMQLEMLFHDHNPSCPPLDGFPVSSQIFATGRCKLRSVSVSSSTIESPDYNHEEVKARLVKSLREEFAKSDVLEVMVETMLRKAESHCASHAKAERDEQSRR